MPIIVEDGTGRADAETYISVADADTYHNLRGNTSWAGLAVATKESSLRKATEYMMQVYRLRWKGSRVSTAQALDWPRQWVEYEDYSFVTVTGSQVIGGLVYYPSNKVPEEVRRACAELALRASSATLAPDLGRRTVSEKVDVIEVQYDQTSPQHVIYRAIDNMVAPFLGVGGGSAFRRAVRS